MIDGGIPPIKPRNIPARPRKSQATHLPTKHGSHSIPNRGVDMDHITGGGLSPPHPFIPGILECDQGDHYKVSSIAPILVASHSADFR